MTCEDRKDLLIDFALGQLDPAAEAELRSHLDGGCEVCARELSEISATWASLAMSLDPVEVPLLFEERLMSRVREKSNGSATTLVEVPKVLPARGKELTQQKSIWPYVLAASLLGAATALLCWRFLPNGLDVARYSSNSTDLETWGDATLDPHSSGFRTVGLKPLTSREGITLSIVRNETVKQWHVLVSGLPSSASDSTLQLWAELKSGDFVPLATLPVSEQGTAGTVIDLPEDSSNFAELWLTEEENASAERPGGELFFRATIE